MQHEGIQCKVRVTFSRAGKSGRGLFGQRLLRAGGQRRQQGLATATARLTTENRRLATPAALDGLGGAVFTWLLLLDVCSQTSRGKQIAKANTEQRHLDGVLCQIRASHL